MSLSRAAFGAVRKLIRSTGFDVVRYNAVPPDLAPEVAETMRAISPYTMTSVERVAALMEAARYITANGIPGDVVECGVWRGGSMMAIARTLLDAGDAARGLFLFDTFEGMSEPSARDVAITGESAGDMLAKTKRSETDSVWCIASLDEVRRNMGSTGYDESLVHYIKGDVEKTIPAQAPDSIALLRLDTDWYESTRHELEHLYPRLVPGGVLIIDDYGAWQGARAAVDEYFTAHPPRPLMHRIDYTGRLAIKVK